MKKIYADELDEVLQIALTQNNLKRLTEALSHLLKNPIAVYDSSYCILAYSSTNQVSDPIWLAGMERGYCRYEYAAQFSHLALSSDRDSQIITGFGKVRRRQAVLRLGQELIGYFSVLENETPFEKIDETYYSLAAQLLAKEVSIFFATSINSLRTSHNSILLDLLNGNFANQALFQQRLVGSELEVPSTFQLLTIDMQHYQNLSTENEQMRSVIARIIPGSWSVYYEQAVIVLINLKSPGIHADSVWDEISDYLLQNHLRGCLSDSFDNLNFIRGHYKCTQFVLEVAKNFHLSAHLFYYEDFKLLRTIEGIPAEEVPFLCSTPVWEIYKEDHLHHTDYLNTLFVYLQHGRSLQGTAHVLFIHRNTVAYRIQKLKEKYGIDFQDESQNMHHYLSCLMLFYTQKPPSPLLKIFLNRTHGSNKVEQVLSE